MTKPKIQPHPGLVAAIALAKSRRQLARIAGCTHTYINRLYQQGKPLPEPYAVPVARELGIALPRLVEKA